MKNWKTTVGGLLISVGTGLQASEDSTLKSVGTIMIGVGSIILGLFAKDNNVTGVGSNARTEKEF